MRAICLTFTLLGLLLNALCGIDAGVFLHARAADSNIPCLNPENSAAQSDLTLQDSEKTVLRILKRGSGNQDIFSDGAFKDFFDVKNPQGFARILKISVGENYNMPFADFEHSSVPLLI